jgi:hypothetical protein
VKPARPSDFIRAAKSREREEYAETRDATYAKGFIREEEAAGGAGPVEGAETEAEEGPEADPPLPEPPLADPPLPEPPLADPPLADPPLADSDVALSSVNA